MEKTAEELFSHPAMDLGDGKDELNLAEFPLSLISKRPEQDTKVLVFEDTIWDSESKMLVARKVTISGSADCGLPNAADEEVLLALIQITKMQGFRSKTVHFSRYQLLQILGWEDNGYYYNRIVSALNTWLGVSIKWHNAWRDYTKKTSWGDKGIVLIQAFTLKKPGKDSTSSITWADHLFESFQAGNLKGLDFGIYRSLRESIAKRMFRFLDKRFYNQETLTFDLATFAYEKIGMKRTYALNGVKQKFKTAIEELTAVGFLKSLPDTERYRKRRAGEWNIIFIKATKEQQQQRALISDNDELPGIENELVKRGVSRPRAKNLAARYPEKHIRAKLEEFDYRMSRGGEDPLHLKNPGGYLAQAIQDDYSSPKGFKSQEEMEQEERRKQEAASKRKALREAKAKQEVQEKADTEAVYRRDSERVNAYLDALSSADRIAVEEAALAASALGSSSTGLLRKSLIFNHVMVILSSRTKGKKGEMDL